MSAVSPELQFESRAEYHRTRLPIFVLLGSYYCGIDWTARRCESLLLAVDPAAGVLNVRFMRLLSLFTDIASQG